MPQARDKNRTGQIFVNSCVLAALLAMQAFTFSLGFSRLSVFYAAIGAALLLFNRTQFNQALPKMRTFGRVLTVFALIFALMHIVRESLDSVAFGRDVRDGVRLALVEAMTAGALCVFALSYRRRGGMRYFLATVALGLLSYVAINVFLEASGWLQGSVELGFQSRYVDGALRWMPPLTKSNGLFSLLNRYAIALAFLIIAFYWRDTPSAIRLALAVSLVPGIWAAIQLEHRAAIIPVLVAPLAYLFTRLKLPALLPTAMLTAMVLVPIVVGVGWWRTAVVPLIPEAVFRMSGDASSINDLSGRESIYDYGIEYMTQSQLGWLGDGPVFRDSFPGFRSDSRTDFLEDANRLVGSPQTFAFHNGFLDLVIPYGPMLAAGFLGIFAIAIVVLSRSAAPLETRDDATLGLIHLAVIFSLNIFDSGFSDFNIIFLALFGTVLAIAATTSGRITRPSPVRIQSVLPRFVTPVRHGGRPVPVLSSSAKRL